VTLDSAIDVLGPPALAVDATGRVDLVYQGGGAVRYGTCRGSCTNRASWSFATVDTLGVWQPFPLAFMITADGERVIVVRVPGGIPHVDMCRSNCANPASWTPAAVDSGGDRGAYAALAQDPAGALHAWYMQFGGAAYTLRQAQCSAACTVGANWQATTVDSGPTAGYFPSAVSDQTGGLHVVYERWDVPTNDNDVEYASCSASCASAPWQHGAVDTVGAFQTFSHGLIIDPSGGLHLLYRTAGGQLRYAVCTDSCGSLGSWQRVTVDSGSGDGAIAMDAQGRFTVAYSRAPGTGFKVARCVSGCMVPGNWQVAEIPGVTVAGLSGAIALNPRGAARIAFAALAGGTGRLVYAEE
jgi:hypothetical protein